MSKLPEPAHRREPADNVVRLIVGGRDGQLTSPAGEQVPVKVFERDKTLIVVLMEIPDGELDRKQLRLAYSSTRGLVRFQGKARLEAYDTLTFHVPEAPDVLQRREFVRVDAAQPVVLISEEDDSVLSGHAIEVSGGGMLLTGPDALGLDASVRFTLNLGDGTAPINGSGRIVRVEDSGRRALMYEHISQGDRQRLIHFIFERQRSALAKGARVAPLKRKRHRTEG
jgi:PilZ domain